ncbi:MAG: hypothetical protein KF691_04915 [Phycisphaeraceae bacterium]|nr:hypothetical protein [Phycisphaeraceae bacterium]
MILYLAADLLWASKIKATADALGLPCRPVRTMEMLEARLADSDVKALIVDLDVAETALQMVAKVKGQRGEVAEGQRNVRVLAFGPHVARDALSAAQAAGADEVMTRGGFDHNMDQVLLRLGAGAT